MGRNQTPDGRKDRYNGQLSRCMVRRLHPRARRGGLGRTRSQRIDRALRRPSGTAHLGAVRRSLRDSHRVLPHAERGGQVGTGVYRVHENRPTCMYQYHPGVVPHCLGTQGTMRSPRRSHCRGWTYIWWASTEVGSDTVSRCRCKRDHSVTRHSTRLWHNAA